MYVEKVKKLYEPVGVSLVEPVQLLFLIMYGHIQTWTGPIKILSNLDRASLCLNVYIKKMKKLYEPTSLHLEP